MIMTILNRNFWGIKRLVQRFCLMPSESGIKRLVQRFCLMPREFSVERFYCDINWVKGHDVSFTTKLFRLYKGLVWLVSKACLTISVDRVYYSSVGQLSVLRLQVSALWYPDWAFGTLPTFTQRIFWEILTLQHFYLIIKKLLLIALPIHLSTSLTLITQRVSLRPSFFIELFFIPFYKKNPHILHKFKVLQKWFSKTIFWKTTVWILHTFFFLHDSQFVAISLRLNNKWTFFPLRNERTRKSSFRESITHSPLKNTFVT